MKKKVLLSSIATIALCLCLIAGSTFALFTDSTNFNIAVTSGDVEVYASASINALYSAKGADAADDEFLIDEHGHTYTHEKQGDTFLNGGTATVTDGNLEIVRITPGDRVDIDIVVDNRSDVAISYRYKVIAEDINLAYGMVVTVEGESYEALASYTSAWRDVVPAPDGKPGAIPTETISVELPVYAGNEYQTEKTENKIESVNYTVIVEAVQGNAVTDDESEVIVYQTKPVVSAEFVADEYQGDIFDEPITNVVVVKDLYLTGEGSVTVDATYNTVVLENVTADVNGNLIESDYYNTYILSDCNIMLDDGEMILVVDDITTQIILSNVYVGDVLVTEENVNDYITGSENIWIYN